MSAAASETFDKIIDCVKTSNLNFCMHLSPFSANISLKKTFIKDRAGVYLSAPIISDSSLQQKVNNFETVIDDLNMRLEKAQKEREQAYETVRILENKLEIKKEKIETDKTDLEDLYNEKKLLQENVVSLETVLKERDEKIDGLERRFKNSECVVDKLNKVVNSNKSKHEKETKMIIKKFKNEIKSWKKDLGLERSKKIKAERNLATLEVIVKELKSKNVESISCQTTHSADVPYSINTQLPPIFGSQLCQISKPLNFLSISLPNLSTLRWVKITEEDMLVNAAEDALNEQHDRQVNHYYREAKLKAESVRQIYEENGIGNLFQET